jgi:hypothetical protein
MVPRPYPETNENQYHRIAQHRGSPRRGVANYIRQVYNKEEINMLRGKEK